MRCFECRYLDRSKVLTCYPPKYYCTYDKTTHFADDECKYEHYPIVRCKDCRHRDLFSCPLADNDFQKDDDFCSWGERSEPLPQYAEWKEPFEKMTESAKVGDHDD